MGVTRILSEDLVSTASIVALPDFSGPLNATGFGALHDPAPGHVVRLPLGGQPRRTEILIAFLVTSPIDTVALINTNIPAGAKITVRGYLTDPTSTSPEPPPTLSWHVTTADRRRQHGQVVLLTTGPAVETRYLVVRIESDVIGYVDIGRIVAGAAWRPTHNFNQDYSVGRTDLGTREISQQTGGAFIFKGKSLRVMTFTLGLLAPADVATAVDLLDHDVGVSGDILFIPNDTLTFNQISQQAIFGSCRGTGDVFSRQFFPNLFERPFRVQERL